MYRLEGVPVTVLNPNREKRVLWAGTTAATVSPIEIEFPPSRGEHGKHSDVLPHLQSLFDRSKEKF